MDFSKRSLQGRILLGFGVIVVVVGLISGWTVTNVSQMRTILGEILTRDIRSIELTSAMRLALHRHHRAALLYLLGQRDTSRMMAVHAEEAFLHNLELSDLEVVDSVSHASLGRIRTIYRQFLLEFSRIDEVSEIEERSGLGSFYLGRILPPVDAINEELVSYRKYLSDRSKANVAEVSTEASFTIYSTVGLAIVLLLFGGFASWRLARSILRPIDHLTVSVRKIADGEYRQSIEPGDAYHELAVLVEHFNAMSVRLAQQESINRRMLATAQLRAEQIVGDLPDVTIVTDAEGRVIYFNRQAEAVLGLPARATIGTLLAEHATAGSAIAMMTADLSSGSIEGEQRVLPLIVGGAERSFGYGARIVHNEEGEIIGYLFRMQDVTSFHRVDELRQKMISTVSHELRTPLTSMGMSLELLLEEGMGANLDRVQRELLENLQEDVRRLGTFVSDLLDLSRIDTGQVHLVPAPCSPRMLVDEVARRCAPMSERHEIQIDTTGVGRDLPRVAADAARIGQVFSNLLTNAIRYTPYRGTITVGAATDGEMVRFSVRDNGPGIAPEEIERVFDRFYQIRDDQRAGGSGLGLSIVKEIVEAHGGRVWVQSAAGFGSSFYFTLPQSTEHTAAADDPTGT